MKLIIQIPCYNEEKTLPATLKDLPKSIKGIDVVETLIIDDGSTDKTIHTAQKMDVDYILSFKNNKGLAYAFSAGIEKCLKLGADIIVNTDADNQYRGQDIPKLVKPVLEGKADMVIGDRQIDTISHFSWMKKKFEKKGSAIIRKLSKTSITDTVSGFRAFSKDAAMRINTFTEFSYTLENLIQLGNQKLKIVSVPIGTNEKLRESRLSKNILNFISSQIATILRVYATYKALKVFTAIGVILILPGLFGFFRFLYFFFTSGGQGHVQSLIFSTALLLIGFIVFMFGIIADMISNNRKLIEKALYKIKKNELKNNKNED